VKLGWLDCSAGVSGDMLLGALADLGALGGLPALVDSLATLGVTVEPTEVTRGGLRAIAVTVAAPPDQPARRLADVTEVINAAAVPDEVRDRAIETFVRLAEAEAHVHGTTAGEVHFHEVGAVDSIIDVLGVCLGLHALGLDALVVSPIALGGGSANTAHGTIPVPTPAAIGLLTGTPLVGHGGPVDVELATPTGIAIVAEWATSSGSMPAMTIDAVGVGAGRREIADHPNVVRLVVGSLEDNRSDADDGWLTIEANVDDLDPRLWPGVLDRLLAAGAADAWLTPILMKKGRPAHTVSALTGRDAVAAVREVLVTETSTIGVRSNPVSKYALERSWITVDVDGQKIRVKLAHDGARRTNVAPEFDDVAAAADALGAAVKDVLARATAAALQALQA
jgi:hypothetical protein